ncbi:MAG: hypothetical protein E7313_00405 [Clostridiales bacterium]|nr:hypothetical protein [Clostridiales bacterium]
MENIVKDILTENNLEIPNKIERCSIGHGNYVFMLDYRQDKKIIRMNDEGNLYAEYENFKYWVSKLKDIDVPVPNVISVGKYKKYNYIILDYIEGEDLGEVYTLLTEEQKMNIAKKIIKIQEKVQDKLLPNNQYGSVYKYNDNTGFDTWKAYILDSLENSKQNIKKNKIFDEDKVNKLIELTEKYSEYFEKVEPKAFLDDISNKNLIIHNGEISGIIDLDWMGFGDLLYFVGYNNMALLDMEVDTNYIDYMIRELNLNNFQKQIVLFYTLVFCVDFMSEKGQTFQDKEIYVDEKIVNKLNCIYDNIINQIR